MPEQTRESKRDSALGSTQDTTATSTTMRDLGTQRERAGAQGGQFQGATEYKVKAGDTLSAIAQRFGVAGGFEALAAFNGITDPSSLSVGQKLKIPSETSAQGPEQGESETSAAPVAETPAREEETVTGTETEAEEAIGDDEIEWMQGAFTITHYTFALEDDPVHHGSELVSAPGLDPTEKYKKSFLGKPYGVKMQGTGLAENGKHIMYVGSGRYAYGIGGAKGKPISWGSIAVDPGVIPHGSEVIIETYRGKGAFIASDTGGAIDGKHIDVFVGAVPIKVAYALGTKKSRVGIWRKR